MLLWEKAVGFLMGYGLKHFPHITLSGTKTGIDVLKAPAEIEKLRLENHFLKQKKADEENLVRLANEVDMQRYNLTFREVDYRVQAEIERRVKKSLPILLVLVSLGAMALSRAGTADAKLVFTSVSITCVCVWLAIWDEVMHITCGAFLELVEHDE